MSSGNGPGLSGVGMRSRAADVRAAARLALPKAFSVLLLTGTLGLMTCSPCPARDMVRVPIKKKGAGPLFQIRNGEAWGFMDRTGRTVISPRFDDEGDFFNGLARVRKNGKWGYVDLSGRVVISYQFLGAGDFREGLAPVQVGRRWGYIDPGGKFLVEPQFQGAAEFSDGLAQFEVWDTIQCATATYSKEGLVPFTREDAPLYAFRLHDARPIDPGGCFSDNARFGFVDKRGKIAIPPALLDAYDFSEGLAAVRAEHSTEPKYGYIDKTGKMVIGARFDQAYPFSEGLAAVETGFRAAENKKVSGAWGFIRRDGSFAIEPRFEMGEGFAEGLAQVFVRPGGWGYIDKTGTLVISPKYSSSSAFSEGFALVLSDDADDMYYVDRSGNKALVLDLPPQWPFSDGLTVAGYAGEQKYVDRRGRIVAPYEVDRP
jgi:hypothetical protein